MNTEIISKYATVLSLVEVGLGSLLHAFQIPLAGQLLSLNQGFLLSRATRLTQMRTSANSISAISALLKSLSPAGKKLTPMLAISAQGLLFTLGPLLFGVHFLGLLVGMTLLCLWAFIQPVLLYLILYGKTLMDVGQYFLVQLQMLTQIQPEFLLWSVGALVCLKILIGGILVVISIKAPDVLIETYLESLQKMGRQRLQRPRPTVGTPIRLATQDLFTPLFFVSLVLTAIFFFVTKQETTTVIWGLLRPIACGFLIFYLIRTISFEKLILRLEQTRFRQFTASFTKAVIAIKQVDLK